MKAYILETLVSTGWRRGGETFWTLDAAEVAGKKLIRRKLARRVHVLAVHVQLSPVLELPEPEGDALVENIVDTIPHASVIRERLSANIKERRVIKMMLRLATKAEAVE